MKINYSGLIGNDIVDLIQSAKESNWRRKRYLEKIFTMAERFLIHSAKDPEIMVWLLWTMKESTYKAASDESKIRSFAPCSLSCNNMIRHENAATCNVIYQDKMYYCRSVITQNYIHTLASAQISLLDKAIVKISLYNASDSTYRNTDPASVSHHGSYLALIYL